MHTNISIEHASLSTAKVEIQTITVRGKKVTQALFRQFKEESPFLYGDHDVCDDHPHSTDSEYIVGTKGRIWGWVNYFPECTYGVIDPANLVWQKNNELRRWVMGKPCAGFRDGWRVSQPAEHPSMKHYNEIIQLPQLFIAM